MSEIIAVTSGKGGTGKSTICSALGFALAERGYRTLIAEFDCVVKCLDTMLGVESSITYDLGSVARGECSPAEAVFSFPEIPCLSVLCAPSDSYTRIDKETVRTVFDALREDFDYIIAETSAGLGSGSTDVAAFADLILINTTPDPVCIRDARAMTDGLCKHSRAPHRLIINRVNPAVFTSDKRVILSGVTDIIGLKPIAVIPEDRALAASVQGKPHPDSSSHAYNALNELARRITGEDVPFAFKVLNQ